MSIDASNSRFPAGRWPGCRLARRLAASIRPDPINAAFDRIRDAKESAPVARQYRKAWPTVVRRLHGDFPRANGRDGRFPAVHRLAYSATWPKPPSRATRLAPNASHVRRLPGPRRG
ncbi:hypothetical protein OR60_21440 [Xanthomonas vesicatoria]|uniref:Uncharacterized protein n=1 Tax=Xanthomonas vesicatoria TaxID=56460 RepID=A0AAJ0N4X8_9XANT|nr:hypothetical protein OR60_21440 [Xanthomonas vesicatoria]KHM94659.1 hypothetical protein OR61_11140 [Xanthomonas vesicatoria]KLB02540.1 hypothetical protein SM19410_00815 [Xanthomonas hortorum pv. gardneri]KLB24868.1 hypothetical protein SM41311_05980 [Xanthomonas hortorum pv. gardneri]KLB26192.1 hypothetical protein SM40611_03940 [Xanthomonas hortorum pv. gardneri]